MPRTLNKNPKSDMSRLRRYAANNLGVIMTDDMSNSKMFRRKDLDIYDQYYDNTQYDHLMDWEVAAKSPTYVPIRDRRPRIIYNLPKVLVNKVASKLVGSATFPQFVIEEDDEDTAFFRTIQKASQFRRSMMDPVKNLLKSGAVFVRFYLINGQIKIEYAQSKYCYPSFDAAGELESIDIKYVYPDWDDLKQNGDPTKKWYKLTLSKTVDIMYDNPEYREGSSPEFNEVARAEHGLGWVQGQWFCTDKDKFNYDGNSIFGDILDFIDDMNYSLSQSSQAISYNQEPQLAVNGVDEDEIDALIKSSQKAWNLGREGKAAYVETNLGGVEQAKEQRDHNRNLMLDVCRVVIQDPEKIAGSAQSGTALNILNGPLVELVDELRAVIEQDMVALLVKIGLTALHYNAMGEETVIQTPPGYVPNSVDMTVQWPPVFPPTLPDIAQMASTASTLANAKIISRETLTRWVAQVIPAVDNVEEELQKIAAEPDLNPFGGGFGGM